MREFLAAALVLLAHTADGSARLATRHRSSSDALTDRYPFYHTSSALAEEASALASSCAGLSFSAESDGAISLPVARLAALGNEERREMKLLMVFGEHARELISPETGLAWLKKLCGPDGSQLRQQTSFVMVLNANPRGREMVEGGEYCTRTNEGGVDLNRNYGYHWQPEHAEDEETGVGSKAGKPVEAFSSGSAAFSEPETRIVARLLNETRPDIFLDVHSGTKGLFMPWDWTTDPIPNESDRQNMKTVLQEVNSKDCPECMVGDCSETVGYLAPGSSADYAYSQGVPFSYIWEIYADAATSQADAADQRAFLAKKKTEDSFLQRKSAVNMQERDASHKSRYLQLEPTFGSEVALPAWAAGDIAEMAPMEQEAKDHCFLTFNPVTKDVYDGTVSRWTSAFVTLCDAVRRVQGGS